MEEKKIPLTEIVPTRVREEDSDDLMLVGVAADIAITGGVFTLVSMGLSALFGDEEEETRLVYQKVPTSIPSSDIVTIEDTPGTSEFRQAGAQTTIWDKSGRPRYVVQPSAYVKALKGPGSLE